MTSCRICATVMASSHGDLRRDRDRASRADLVELRLDGLDEPDPDAALQGRTRPAVITCRPRWEGGRFEGGEDERYRLLAAALDAGVEYVDVEWGAPFRDELLKGSADRIILSWHEFGCVPPDLDDRVRAMLATGAALVKVAVLARRLTDLPVLAACGRQHGSGGRLVLIGMGEAGVATRILPSRFGSAWTYAGDRVAPGQLSLDRLLDEFRVREVGAGTRVYGLVGRSVRRSVSPAMHNAAFAATGVDAVYLPVEAEEFEDVDASRAVLGLEGCSVTAPHKVAAARASVSRDALASRLDAANTMRWSPASGGWEATNTDLEGFLAPLEGEALRGLRATVLGAGGAARAVVAGLVDRQARVTVRARDASRARAAAEPFGAEWGLLPVPQGTWDLLVNATPVGSRPDVASSPVRGEALDGRLVYDLVYDPMETVLLRDARRRGCATIGGLDMLVAQGARQFEWWTGRPAPVELMRAAAARRIQAMDSEWSDRTEDRRAP